MADENAIPTAPAVTEMPAPDFSAVESEISAFNQQIEKPIEAAAAQPAKEADAPTQDPARPPADKEADEPKEDEAKEEAEKTDDAAKESAEEAAFTFTPDADLETFEQEKAAYLETVEITPEIEQIFSRYEAEIGKQRQTLEQIEQIGGLETVEKMFAAVGKLFDTSEDGETFTPNAEPIVELLRTDYRSEFPAIAKKVFLSDSVKYQGASVFQEMLIDIYGVDAGKMRNIANYLQSDDFQLPAAPPRTPAKISATLADAFNSIPETERFEIESLSDEVVRLESELASAGSDLTYRDEVRADLETAQNRLAGKIRLLEDAQFGINSRRAEADAKTRQQRDESVRFQTRVAETYNKEIFGLMDNFANELAPRLSFLDEDMQKPQARSILARVQNALAFDFDDKYNFLPDPTADYFAKQLKDEGVQFDFERGRHLLHDHLKATRKLELMKKQGASPQAIQTATHEKNRIMQNITLEQKDLIGKLGARFVKSSNNATDKKIDQIRAKKQAVRPVVSGNRAAAPNKTPTASEIDAEISRFNRAVQSGDLETMQRHYR